jgi:hypothetical protein
MSMHDLIVDAQRLSDDALLASAASLIGRERVVTARLVAHLAEMDARGLAQKQGHSSLFAYCRTVLGFSESEAGGRIEAARAARRFPLILDLLQANELTMTAAAILGRHLTPDNHDAVLRAARRKTKEQIKEILAAIVPQPDVPTSVRKVPPARAEPSLAMLPLSGAGAAPAGPNAAVAPANLTAPGTPARAVVEPLAPERYRYQLTIDAETRDLLALARDLSSHDGADDAALLKEAMQLLVAERARRKFATTATPRPSPGTKPDSRHVPAQVKRDVYVRDLGRCAFVSRDGRRCNERRFVEFHHVKPFEAGGEATTENIQLRCRAHNQYEARMYFRRDRPDAGPVQPGLFPAP